MAEVIRSANEYIKDVGPIWLLPPAVLGGAEWALTKVGAKVPSLPTWVWVVVLVVWFLCAQFWAYHKVRLQRDARPAENQTTVNVNAPSAVTVQAMPTASVAESVVPGEVAVTRLPAARKDRKRQRPPSGQGQLPLH